MEQQGKLAIRLGKILSPEKLPDRFSVAYVYVPEKPDERAYGSLYFVIEIMRTDDLAEEASQTIVSTMIDEFYHNLYLEPFVSFEIALKKANESLQALAERNETIWYQKLNGLIACVSSETLHLSQTGSAEAYLIRANSISHISQGLFVPGDRSSSYQPFLNIASGTIQAGDRLFLSSSELFNHVSLERLRRIASEGGSAVIINQIAKILRKEAVTAVDCLVLEAASEDLLSGSHIASAADEVWLEEPKKLADSLIAGSKEFQNKAKIFSREFLAKSITFYKDVAKPAISNVLSKTKELTHKTSDATKEMLNKHRSETAKIAKEHPRDIFEGPGKNVQEVVDQAHWKDKLSAAVKVAKEGATKSTSKLNPYLEKVGLTKASPNFSRNLRRVIIAGVIVLLIIFGISLTRLGSKAKNENNTAKAKISFDAAWDKEKSAESAINYKDTKKAQTLFQEALNLAKTANPKGDTKEYQDLVDTINRQLDSLSNIFHITETIAADFTNVEENSQVLGISVQGGSIYAFTSKAKIFMVASSTSKPTLVSDAQTIGSFAFGARNSDEKIIYYTDSKDVRQFNPSAKTVDSLYPQDDAWKNAISLATFSNNIYLLDAKGNQIWKYLPTVNGFSSASAYVQDETKISNGVSIAIDGTVLVLNSNGSVVRFSQGVGSPLDLTGMPAGKDKLKYPIQILKEENTNIYILDIGEQRVVELNDSGKYLRSFVLPAFADAKSMSADYSNNKLYVLAKDKVYTVDITPPATTNE